MSIVENERLRNLEEAHRDHAENHKALKVIVESAFPKDEEGNPDYNGHRSYHKKQGADAAAFALTKAKIVKDIISWAVIGVLTIVGSALVQTYFLSAATVVK